MHFDWQDSLEASTRHAILARLRALGEFNELSAKSFISVAFEQQLLQKLSPKKLRMYIDASFLPSVEIEVLRAIFGPLRREVRPRAPARRHNELAE